MPKSNIHIRQAIQNDAPSLASCIDAAYAQYTGQIPNLPSFSDGCAEDIEHNQVWVAITGEDIVGGLVLIAQEDNLKLANIAVHPNHHGKGIGRQLIELAEQEARRQGYHEMCLNTHTAMPANIALYRHLGWEEIATNENTVSMKKLL